MPVADGRESRRAESVSLFVAGPRERENAYKHSVKTIETAARLKAAVVVLHLGCIDMKEYTGKLLEMVQHGQKETSRYSALCETVMEKREKKKEHYAQFASEMLERLARLADERGIKLGIENRRPWRNFRWIRTLNCCCASLTVPALAIGMIAATRRSRKTSDSSTIGRTWKPCRPACWDFMCMTWVSRDTTIAPPGSGTIDFAALKPMVKPGHIKVFELSPNLSLDEVVKGVAHIHRLGLRHEKAQGVVERRVAGGGVPAAVAVDFSFHISQ